VTDLQAGQAVGPSVQALNAAVNKTHGIVKGTVDDKPANELRAQLAHLKAVLAERKALVAESKSTGGWGTTGDVEPAAAATASST